MTPPAAVLAKFGVSDPALIAETGIARVWRVQHADGAAALKIYNDNDPKDEWPGFALLHALDGKGVVRLIAHADGAALMEWLDGPSLGDLTRTGQDDQAAAELARVARQIHNANVTIDLPILSDRFRALRDLHIANDWPAHIRHGLGRCKTLAADLLANQRDIRPLHGDLHHDNIKRGPSGFAAFDAKGVIGDRAYDLANAFQNPVDAPSIVNDPDRVRYLAATWGQALDITPKRLISWAVAHCGLSIAWTGSIPDNHQTDLLGMFLGVLDSDN